MAKKSHIVSATIFAVIATAVLIALGIWQLNRKVWKENLIEIINARLAQAPEDLPKPAELLHFTQANDEFRRVSFSAKFLPGEMALVYTSGSAFRPDIQGAGYWVFAPARLKDGGLVIVNRGFIPFDRIDLALRASNADDYTQIVGVMRWPDLGTIFTPPSEPQRNMWYLRDPQMIAAAKKWGVVAPIYIEQEAPVSPGGWPKPGRLQVNLPNNHLQYALTWFGLALALASVYGFWLVSRLRGLPCESV